MPTLTYADAIALFNRIPTILVKITVPGTLTGSQVFYFSPYNGANISSQIGKSVRTYLMSWSGRSAKILPNLSDTERARYTLTMKDDNNPGDFDSTVFSVYQGGSFWRRLVAVQPNYAGSTVEILRGFVDPNFPETSFQRVFIGSLVEINMDVDTVSVIAKDDSVSFSGNMPAEITDTNLVYGTVAATDKIISVTNALEFSDPAGTAYSGAVGWLSKDCLPMQIRLRPESIPVIATNLAWTAGPRKLAQTGVFTNYTFTPGDTVLLSGPTGITADAVVISGRIDNDTIALVDSISDTDIAAGGSPTIKIRPREDIAIASNDGVHTLTVVENWAKMSEDFSDISWIKVNAAVTSGVSVGPWGGVGTADKVVFTAVYGAIYEFSAATSATDSWCFSVWLRATSAATVGNADISVLNTASIATYTATLTTDWQRFEITGVMSGASAIRVMISQSAAGYVSELYVWGASLQMGTTRGFYTPTNKSTTAPIPGLYAGRGICGTTAHACAAGSIVKEVINYCPLLDITAGLHPIFILRDLINKASVPVADVDETYFNREFHFIESVEMRRSGSLAVTASKLNDLIGEVRENGMIDLWVSELGQFRVVYGFRGTLAGVNSSTLTDETNIILKSATVQSNKAQSQFTRVYVYYDLIGGHDGTNRTDFNAVQVVIDFSSEKNIQPIVSIVFAKWIYRSSDAIALAGRKVSRFKLGARILDCSLDLKDDLSYNVGDYFLLNSVDAMKAPATGTSVIRTPVNWEVVQKTDDFQNGRIKIQAMEARGLRYAIISPTWSPAVTYDTASAYQQQYGFIGDANNLVGIGGDDGFYIL